ncbi:MAG: hypothetical protein IJ165_12735 [Proteobacteria bacterium]|nr:hypothetical protein [Pseudomonadota bacterium]
MSEKYMNRCRTGVLSASVCAFAILSGCELDSIVVACGTEDEPMAGFILNDPMQPVTSNSELSSGERFDKIDIDTYKARNICPDSWFCSRVYSMDQDEVGAYACSQCAKPGFIQCGGFCVDIYHDLENCGSCGKACEDWEACDGGQCVETKACDEGYHAYHGACEADELTHCGSHSNDCTALPGWAAGTCEAGGCVVSACSSEYALINGRCVFRLVCEGGRHQYEDTCEDNTVENCGAHGYGCHDLVGWEDGYCTEKGRCVPSVCKDGFELVDNQCVPISACPGGSHFYAGSCEPNTLEHCGVHDNDCSSMLAWQDGECTEDGKCLVSRCGQGYCVENLVCQDGSYNKNACGTDGNACIRCGEGMICKEGVCILSECDLGQHKSGESCVPDDMGNCGFEGHVCKSAHATDMTCDKGECVVLSCEPGFHIYNNACEADTVDHCGAHGNACKSIVGDWASGSCVDRKCKPDTCVGGHPHEMACERDTNENCGAHGKVCEVAHATTSCEVGYCRVVRCDSGYYLSINGEECDDSVSHNHANNGEFEDPWGLVWDSYARGEETYLNALEACKKMGARLPTVTELHRNVYADKVSGLANETNTEKLWSMSVSATNKITAVELAKGTTDSISAMTKMRFRCVWDAEPRPITFSGANCHGNPGEDGCVTLKVGKITYTVDRRDRYKQNWFAASDECRQLGARLPYMGEFASLVRAGWPNGTNEELWTETYREAVAVALPWSGTDKAWTYTTNKPGYHGTGKLYPFRCISEQVALEGGKPVFPQPKAVNAFEVNPLLRIDNAPRKAANYWNATLECMNDGGHIARADEFSAAIKSGLLKPSNDTGSTWYMTGTGIGGFSIARMRWGTTAKDPRLHYAGSDRDSHSVTNATYKFYCAYRPNRAYDAAYFEYLKTNKEIEAYQVSGVTHYGKNYESEKENDLFTKTETAVSYGMLVARDDELLMLTSKKFPIAGTELLMTASPTSAGDDSIRMRAFNWKGTGEIKSSNYGRVKYTGGNGFVAYTSSVIH